MLKAKSFNRETAWIPNLGDIENLVFQGGGVKGVAYLGALRKLLDKNSRYRINLDKIKRVAGASAGAITALFIALGNDIDKLDDLINNLDLTSLLDEGTDYGGTVDRDYILKFMNIFESIKLNKADLAFYYIYQIFKALGEDLLTKKFDEWVNILKKYADDIPGLDIIVSIVGDVFSDYFTKLQKELSATIVEKAEAWAAFLYEKITNLDIVKIEKDLVAEFFPDQAALDAFNSTITNILLVAYTGNTGLFAGDTMLTWLEDQLKTVVTADISFEEFHELQGKFSKNGSTFKDLYIVALDLGTGLTKIFSHRHTPTVLVADAAYASLSIPFFFTAHKVRCKVNGTITDYIDIDSKNGTYIPLYADGGVLDNYPIWLFDNTRYLNSFLYGPARNFYNERTLGLKLVKQEERDLFEKGLARVPSVNFGAKTSDYTIALAKAFISKQDSDHYHSKGKQRTIYIDTLDISFVNFNLSDTNKKKLIAEGETGALNYLNSTHVHALKAYQYSFRKFAYDSLKVGVGSMIVPVTFFSAISLTVDQPGNDANAISRRDVFLVGLMFGGVMGINGIAAELLSRTIANSRITIFNTDVFKQGSIFRKTRKSNKPQSDREIIAGTALISCAVTGMVFGSFFSDDKNAFSIGIVTTITSLVCSGLASYVNIQLSGMSKTP